MKEVVKHSKINVNAREFHIYTGSVLEKGLILSEIFERGQFIGSKEIPFNQRSRSTVSAKVNFLKEIAADLHKSTLDEINMLFYIHQMVILDI